MKNAFTMIELVFVIVIIGILAVVAVPKLAPIVGTAKDAKAIATLASVRSSLSTERQKRILRGSFDDIDDLGDDTYVFDTFSDSTNSVLEYSMKSCSNSGCWERKSTGPEFWYHFSSSKTAKFKINDKNKFVCVTTDDSENTANCYKLTK